MRLPDERWERKKRWGRIGYPDPESLGREAKAGISNVRYGSIAVKNPKLESGRFVMHALASLGGVNLRALLLPLACLVTACSSGGLTYQRVSQIEQNIRMPAGSAPLSTYARYYTDPRRYSEGDLPFTTLIDPICGWPEPRQSPVVVALFVEPNLWGSHSAGAHIVEASRLPYPVHGGCRAVNLILDPVSGSTLAAWCNVDDQDPVAPDPP